MKKILTLAVVALFTVASAQNLGTFKQRLANPVKVDSLTTIHSTVKITEHLDAENIISTTPAKEQSSVNGYRIMLFMSNSQNARTEAFAACDTLAVRVPGLQTYVTYDNPYFKVATGNCVSQEEALVLLQRIKPSFPKAFIMRENIPLTELSK